MIRQLLSRGGWVIAFACLAIAVGRSYAAKSVPAPRRLSGGERAVVGRAAAALEPDWRRGNVYHFPADCWSQDDDYGADEWHWVRDEAGRRGVPVTDIFQAIDEDLKAFPVEPPRKANGCPCKPRPFTN